MNIETGEFRSREEAAAAEAFNKGKPSEVSGNKPEVEGTGPFEQLKKMLNQEQEHFRSKRQIAERKFNERTANSSGWLELGNYKATQILEDLSKTTTDPAALREQIDALIAQTPDDDDSTLYALTTLSMELRKIYASDQTNEKVQTENEENSITNEETESNPENPEPVTPEVATDNYEKHGPTVQAITKFFIPDVYDAFQDIEQHGFDVDYMRSLVEQAQETLELAPEESQRVDITHQLETMLESLNAPSHEQAQTEFVTEFNQLLGILNHNFRMTVAQSEIGSEFNPNLQSAVDVIETSDPSLDRKIARSAKIGVVMHDWQQRSVKGDLISQKSLGISRERVVVYKYTPPQA